jgi:hypothetical protein
MKTAFLIFVLCFTASIAFASDKSVNGYWRDSDRDGVKDTYVQPYHRSGQNSNPYDNYSTKGNSNPYTGQPGTVEPKPNPYYQEQPYSNPYKSNYR